MGDDDLTELEQELIAFIRYLEIMELQPNAWGTAPHAANRKLDNLKERGVIDEGGQRYDNDGDMHTWRHEYDTTKVAQ